MRTKMATRSMIGCLNVDGTVTATYCHYDGYPMGVGKTLLENYKTYTQGQLIANCGYLSSLQETVRESLVKSANVEDPITVTMEDYFNTDDDYGMMGTEYLYLQYFSGDWFVFDCSTNKLYDLKEKVERLATKELENY
jgi:hypothetical protein